MHWWFIPGFVMLPEFLSLSLITQLDFNYMANGVKKTFLPQMRL